MIPKCEVWFVMDETMLVLCEPLNTMSVCNKQDILLPVGMRVRDAKSSIDADGSYELA